MPDAILAACPVIVGQPGAVIPVPTWHQDFRTYWRVAREYCAWLYTPDGKTIEMSLLTTSTVQDDPTRRKCSLPANVSDERYPPSSIAYLVIVHSHPMADRLSEDDLYLLADMAKVHGATTMLQGREVSISIVAFFGRERNGKTECAGFYHYVPARSNEMLKFTIDDKNHLRGTVVAHVTWTPEGLVRIAPVGQ